MRNFVHLFASLVVLTIVSTTQAQEVIEDDESSREMTCQEARQRAEEQITVVLASKVKSQDLEIKIIELQTALYCQSLQLSEVSRRVFRAESKPEVDLNASEECPVGQLSRVVKIKTTEDQLAHLKKFEEVCQGNRHFANYVSLVKSLRQAKEALEAERASEKLTRRVGIMEKKVAERLALEESMSSLEGYQLPVETTRIVLTSGCASKAEDVNGMCATRLDHEESRRKAVCGLYPLNRGRGTVPVPASLKDPNLVLIQMDIDGKRGPEKTLYACLWNSAQQVTIQKIKHREEVHLLEVIVGEDLGVDEKTQKPIFRATPYRSFQYVGQVKPRFKYQPMLTFGTLSNFPNFIKYW